MPLSIQALAERIEKDNFNLLAINTSHLIAYDAIPLLEDHRDPFDHLLLAQTMSENMPIIYSDTNFPYYKAYIQLVEN